LTYGGLRSHVIGALITNDSVELLYYDRSIIVKSEPFNFKRDTARFIAMLRGVGSLSPFQWGYHPLLPTPTGPFEKEKLQQPFDGLVMQLQNANTLKLGHIIFQSHGLISRGTCVTRATMQLPAVQQGRAVVVKWSSASRTAEANIIQAATDRAVRNNAAWILNHLPKILHHEEHKHNGDDPQICLSTHFGLDTYELRALRIVVLEELRPITELSEAPQLAEALRGIFRCTWGAG
jgi:hypothetical protein